MFGLVILGVGALYLAIAIGAVVGAVRYARKRQKSVWLFGATVALVVYLIPFWDQIPTVFSHHYYCEREAGFWINKTLDQWKAENPGVVESLIDNSPNDYPNWPHQEWRGKQIASINQRFGMLYTNHLASPSETELFLNVWRWKIEFIDTKTGEVLAHSVNFSAGNNGYIGGMHSLKFWLVSPRCGGDIENADRFGEFVKPFRGVKNVR